jgi:DNA modification methylase
MERLNEWVTLYEGRCEDVLPTLSGIDAVVTDPPYGVDLGKTNSNTGGKHGLVRKEYASYSDTYEDYVQLVPPVINRCLQMTKRAAVFIGPHLWEMPKANAIGGVYVPAASARHSWGFKNFLPVLFYGTAPDLHLGCKEQTVITSTEQSEKNGHPCPKPIGWMRWLVRLTTRRGETILDPFAGSGTTAIAAMFEKRKCILIEKDAAYCDIIRKRVEQADCKNPGNIFATLTM